MKENILSMHFGFKFNKSGIHTSRTIMLDELLLLLSHVRDKDATKDVYVKAIIEDNCLAKRSVKNRKLTATYLIELYGLDPGLPLFRALRYFWERDDEARPLLALPCAYTRDPLLRLSMPFILGHPEGDVIDRKLLEEHIEESNPSRFSKNTLCSLTQNLNSSWTKSGHLKGKVTKFRTKAIATRGSCLCPFYSLYKRWKGPSLAIYRIYATFGFP